MNAKAQSLREAAKRLGVSLYRVYKWKHQGCPALQRPPYDTAAIATWRDSVGRTKQEQNDNQRKLRPAIVGGVFVLLAAFVGIFVPVVSHYLGRTPNLVATNAVPVTINSRFGVRVVLSNNSDLPEAVTSIRLTLRQQGPPLDTAGYRTYSISGSVDYAGTIAGSAQTQYDQLPDDIVTFKVDGHVTIWSTGGWEMQITVPVQEEVDRNSHFFVALLLPNSMDVTSQSWVLGHRHLGDYVSGDPKKMFHLKRYLADVGAMGLEIAVNYGEDDDSTYTGSIEF